MKITMTTAFKKTVKKLMRNQIAFIEDVIDEIARNPEIGELKKGDLASVRVHKFYIHKQLLLLAYIYSEDELALISLNSHENFYRNLKTLMN